MEVAIETGAAPKMNRRQKSKVRTRQRVLEGAKALFEQVGFEKATIRAIAKKIGMSTGAVFANFKDKADLYQAVYGHGPLSPEHGQQLAALVRRMLVEMQDEVDQRKSGGNAESWVELETIAVDASTVLSRLPVGSVVGCC